MSLNRVLPPLPKELDSILNKFADKAVLFTANTSHNVARDSSVQFCGPVASTIQYEFNLNLHYHASEIDTCLRLIGGSEAAEVSKAGGPSHPRTASKIMELSERDVDLKHKHSPREKVPVTQQLHLQGPKKGPFPVNAILHPNVEGNWISASIVLRFGFEHQQASDHKDVPTFMSRRCKKTRMFIDLTCGKLEGEPRGQYRFYIVNHCDNFHILLGTRLCP